MDENLDFSRSRLAWSDEIEVGKLKISAPALIEALTPHLTEERIARLNTVVGGRSLRLATVLENIHDRGNVSAVMRSCEAFGYLNVNLVDAPGAKFKAANRITRGAEKWLDVRSFNYPQAAVEKLRAGGYKIWATDLDTQDSIDTIDWTQPTAIVLGNEKDGVSKEMISLCDGRFRIPMAGFSQSFNISVAAALIFYRAHLEQRKVDCSLSDEQKLQVLANYYLRCFDNPEAILRAKGFT